MLDYYTCNKHIDIWKIKKFIKESESARGKVKSMISLIIPARGEISRFSKMVDDDYYTAFYTRNQSLLDTMASAKISLKRYDANPVDRYNKTLVNGLVLYSGTLITDEGKEIKVAIAFEPYRPIYASLYVCDNRFHTEALSAFLESNDKDDTFGFIVMDDKGALFATLSGNTVEVLHKSKVNLPIIKDVHSPFLMEKCHDYVRGTALLAEKLFIDPATDMCNVSGLILAGSDHFQTELSQSGRFHSFLKEKIKGLVDISYGGEVGLNEAINSSSKILADVKLMHEKSVIRLFFKRIGEFEGNCVFGVDDTLRRFWRRELRYLIVWENLDINLYMLKNNTSCEFARKYLNKEQEADESNFRDPVTNAELEVKGKTSLHEWLAYSYYKNFRCKLVFVITNRFQEGSQFCRAFCGIGGIFHSSRDHRVVDWPVYDEDNSDEEFHDEDNSDEEFHDKEACDEETSDEDQSVFIFDE